MSSRHNGHNGGVNRHDLAVARIVQGAIQASNLPPAAARAVFRSLDAAGMKPADLPAVEDAAAPHAPPQHTPETIRRIQKSIDQQQEGLVLALVRERLELDGLELHELEEGELAAFNYERTEALPAFREYELQGKPLVRFYPPEVAMEDGFMLVNLCYRVPA